MYNPKINSHHQVTYGLPNPKGIFELSNNLWIIQSEMEIECNFLFA